MPSDFRKDLVNYVLSRIDCSNDLDRTVKSRPSKKYILGSLAPRKEQSDNWDMGEEANSDKASIRATRLRASFLLNKEELESQHTLSIIIQGYVFYKISSEEINDEAESGRDMEVSTHDISKQKFIWKRETFRFSKNVVIRPNVKDYTEKLDFTDIINSCNSDEVLLYKIPLDTWQGQLNIKIEEFEKENDIIHVYFSNTSKEEQKKDFNLEKTLFDCKLRIDIENLTNSQFVEEYNYNGFKQRYYYDFRTVNCQARFVEGSKGKIIQTDNHYLFEQEEIETLTSTEDLDLSFNSLSQTRWQDNLEAVHQLMVDLYSKYSQSKSKEEDGFFHRIGNRQVEIKEFESTLGNFKKMMDSFKEGLKYIISDEKASIAFQNMNEVFENYYRNKLGPSLDESNPPSWRVFQLVFIVSIARSVVGGEELDVVDVLHVATGGGKSEAYFGLLVFSMFYERLEGKLDGVTALVKFPLRMLSIQQLERLSSVIIYAEKLRQEKIDTFKGQEFSLGYYVGNSEDFPDTYSRSRSELYSDSKLSKLKVEPVYSKILSYCPLCKYESRGKVRIIDDTSKKRLLHQCESNLEHRFSIYYSDREIFRFRPTVIVSTVDKWASLSSQRRARSLLGGGGSMCPNGHGFIPSGDKCEDKKEDGLCDYIGLNEGTSPGPILNIQDEMHLLKESFGTISSHFEGLIESIIYENSNGRKIKHVAMSATLNGVRSQIRELYKKDSFVISGDSSIVDNPAFALFFKKTGHTKRLIYGMIPNLRDNHYATLRSILHATEFLDVEQRRFMEDPKTWLFKYGMKEEDQAINTFRDFLSILTYHLKKQDAEDMNRFSGAVINDVMKKLAGIAIRGMVLTGDKGIDELKSTIDKVKSMALEYKVEHQISTDAYYYPIFSTSVVSHGVDLEELNLMVFQGIPYTTSEYIQALSRVGRKREGVVLVWLYPNRVRDGSFFKNFKRYHESLDHEVQPAPIKRNSKLGVKQTVNSLFCAGIIQFLSNKHGRPLIHKEDVEQLTSEDKKELIQFIKSAYGINVNLDIAFEVESRLHQICESHNRPREFFPNVLSESGEYYYRNQSGMRGIQGNLLLKPTGKTKPLLKQIEGED